MARVRDPQSARFLHDHWITAASDAANLIRQASRGYAVRRPPDEKKLLSQGQKDAGYTVERVSLKDQLKYAEMIITKLSGSGEESSLVGIMAGMSLEQLKQTILEDGKTPYLNTWDKFKRYFVVGPDFEDVDIKHPDIKKKLNSVYFTKELLLFIILHRRYCAHAWWIPTGAQQNMMHMMGKMGPNCRTGIFTSGNGAGKSSFLYNTIIALLLPKDTILNPWAAREEFFIDRNKWAHFYGPNGNHALAIIMRRNAIDEVLLRELQRWAPKDSYTIDTKGKHWATSIEFKNGGTLTVYTTDQKVAQIAGPNYDAVFSDEPFPLIWYGEALKRSRGKGIFVSVMTPKWDTNADMFINEVRGLPDDEYVFQKVHLHSACMVRGTRGFRTKEEINSDEKSTRKEEYQAVVCGEPMALAGKVLTEIKPSINLISSAQAMEWIREEGCSWYSSIDPHSNLPHLLGIAARLKDGRIIFVKEWPKWVPGCDFKMELTAQNWLQYFLAPRPMMFHKMTNFGCKNPEQFSHLARHIEKGVIDEYCGGYNDSNIPLYPKVGTEIIRRYCDPREMAKPSSTSTLTLQEIWWKAGLHITASRGAGDVKAGHELVNKLLGGLIKENGESEPPMLFVVEEECYTIAHHLYNLSYKIDESKASLEGTLSNNYNEFFKHGVDVVRYLVQMNPIYIESEALKNKQRMAQEPKRQKSKGMFAYA